MKITFLQRLTLVLLAVSSILLCTGFSLMLINNGTIHIRHSPAPVDAELVFNGKYIDLLTLERQSAPLGNEEIRVTMIDTETGYPAASDLALVDKNDRRLTYVNVVGFRYQGLPAMLRFTNNVADGFVYQDSLSTFLENGDLNNVWETDPNLLQQALADYTDQVSALIG